MVIQHNMLASFTQREFNISTGNKAKATEKLSSGYRINRAADDAAGLTISEDMRWMIRGLNRADKNCQDGASFCQVADGAMQEIHAMLDRMKELTVQGANDTNTELDRSNIQDELDQISKEIDRITGTTDFNTKPVFGPVRKMIEYDVEVGTGANIAVNSTTQSTFLKGIGLGEILGEGYYWDGGALNDSLNLGDTAHFSTGQKLYALNSSSYIGYTKDELINRLAKATGADDTAVKTVLESGNDGTFSLSGTSGLYHLTVGHNDQGITDTLGMALPATDVKLTQTLSDGSEKTLLTARLQGLGTSNIEGSCGYSKTENYPSAWLDFSLAGKAYDISSLDGQGFNSTCCTCQAHYSIIFSMEEQEQTDPTTGANFTYNAENSLSKSLTINISECNDGNDIVDAILRATSSCPGFTDHYTQYAASMDEHFSTLYIYDNRNYTLGSSSNRSTFETVPRNSMGQMQIGDTVIYEPGSLRKVKEFVNEDLWIQSGATNLSGFFIQRPCVSAAILGVDKLSVEDYDDASASLATIEAAIETLNSERSMVGAQQNRLETASKVDANTSENTQYAESRIRDTDMATEMVNFSKQNILEQFGQSMLAQANQSTQSILSLLG